MTSFLTGEELKSLGLRRYGENVLISRKCSIYGAKDMEIGDNVRIDDFCILSGKIRIGSNIHISAYVALYGAFGIELDDFTGISPRSTIYSAMDDFSGDYLIGPIHSGNETNVTGGKVIMRRYSQIGCNSVIFPSVEIGEGTVIGAMSLVRKSIPGWQIWIGVPARFLKARNKRLLRYITMNQPITPPHRRFNKMISWQLCA